MKKQSESEKVYVVSVHRPRSPKTGRRGFSIKIETWFKGPVMEAVWYWANEYITNRVMKSYAKAVSSKKSSIKIAEFRAIPGDQLKRLQAAEKAMITRRRREAGKKAAATRKKKRELMGLMVPRYDLIVNKK